MAEEVMMAKKLYDILGVSEDADKKAINSAYKKLAKKYHPDLNKGEDTTIKMQEINKAHDILTDDKKRALYDEFGEKALEADFNEDVLNSYKYSWNRSSGANGFGPGAGWPFGFDDDIFGSMFGGARTQDFGNYGGYGDFYQQYQPQPQKGQDLDADINISFMKAIKGGSETVSFVRSGANGQETVTYDINIPQGIREGQKIRLAGKGGPGVNGGADGDLLLKVHIRPDNTFTREGDDINVTVTVDFVKAILGGEVEVPTLDGSVTLKIPAGTQPNQKFRLKGKGVQSVRGTGDEFAQIKVTLPKTVTPEQKELLEKFSEA